MPSAIPEWIIELFEVWGYVLVFLGVFLESIFLTGWLAPGTAVILLGGFFSRRGDLNVFVVAGIAVAAALMGDSTGYVIGRKGGEAIVQRYSDRFKIGERAGKARDYFDRYGPVTVLFGRLVSGLDAFVPLTAGISKMPFYKYIAYDIPPVLVWCVGLTALGYFFGQQWETIEKVIDWVGWGVLGIVALAFAGYLLYRRLKKRKEEKEGRDGTDESKQEMEGRDGTDEGKQEKDGRDGSDEGCPD